MNILTWHSIIVSQFATELKLLLTTIVTFWPVYTLKQFECSTSEISKLLQNNAYLSYPLGLTSFGSIVFGRYWLRNLSYITTRIKYVWKPYKFSTVKQVWYLCKLHVALNLYLLLVNESRHSLLWRLTHSG